MYMQIQRITLADGITLVFSPEVFYIIKYILDNGEIGTVLPFQTVPVAAFNIRKGKNIK